MQELLARSFPSNVTYLTNIIGELSVHIRNVPLSNRMLEQMSFWLLSFAFLFGSVRKA
jgi:hypothetical protein